MDSGASGLQEMQRVHVPTRLALRNSTSVFSIFCQVKKGLHFECVRMPGTQVLLQSFEGPSLAWRFQCISSHHIPFLCTPMLSATVRQNDAYDSSNRARPSSVWHCPMH